LYAHSPFGISAAAATPKYRGCAAERAAAPDGAQPSRRAGNLVHTCHVTLVATRYTAMQ
jgi:hypothetical protein